MTLKYVQKFHIVLKYLIMLHQLYLVSFNTTENIKISEYLLRCSTS